MRPFALVLVLSIFSAQCDDTELPAGPACDCVCSNERVPACYSRGRNDCPPNPACTTDEECDVFCQSDALCAEPDPKYAECRRGDDPDRNADLYCVQTPQCGDVTQEECRERLERFGCNFEWLFYRMCVAEEGCDSEYCDRFLGSWDQCRAQEEESG